LSVTILMFACTTNNEATFFGFDIPEKSKKAQMHVLILRCKGYWELWHALCLTPTGTDIRRVCWGYELWLLRHIFVASICLKAQKTLVSCPTRAMRRLFPALIKAFKLFQRQLGLFLRRWCYRVQLYESVDSYRCSFGYRKRLFHALPGRCEGFFSPN
jgi:hypothetical protein